jgi:hypothetical protein
MPGSVASHLTVFPAWAVGYGRVGGGYGECRELWFSPKTPYCRFGVSNGWLMALPCSLGAQASGELERGSEEVARLVYSMLQDANSIGHAQTAEPGTFQRLSSTPALAPDRSFSTHLLTPVRRLLAVTFSGFEYMCAVGADCIYVIKRNI